MSKSPTENPSQSGLQKRLLETGIAGTESSDEASRLLAEADASLRLGLIDQAIEHLAGAVHRDPSLRDLREALVKLYVARRQYQSAIAELWALLSPCDDPREEIRFLRYIIRLGESNPVAEERLKSILEQHNLEAPKSQDELSLQQLSIGEVEEELRVQLERRRPLSDMAQTLNIYHAATPSRVDLEQLPGAVTRSDTAAVEALAEEIALSSDDFQEQLREIDQLLDATRYEAAHKKLLVLSARYPHSTKVRGRLGVLKHVLPKSVREAARSDIHAAQTLPPWAEQAPVRPTVEMPKSALARVSAQTIEVTPVDIQEERAVKSAPPPPRSVPPPPRSIPPSPRSTPPPPPPPPSKLRLDPISEAEQALRSGIALRGSGQFDSAIAMFDKARSDAKFGAPAALHAGLCYRELDRPRDAIAVFMTGINSPTASEADLSELFYELGATHEQLGNASEAILFYQLSLGTGSVYRDANQRIKKLETTPLAT